MTADQRVIQAREYLTGARRRKVAELPPSVLAREDAELRRLLGQVLDALAESTMATVPDSRVAGHESEPASRLPWRLTVRQALIDAIRWREEADPTKDTADQVALYMTAARVLGIDLGPGGAR